MHTVHVEEQQAGCLDLCMSTRTFVKCSILISAYGSQLFNIEMQSKAYDDTMYNCDENQLLHGRYGKVVMAPLDTFPLSAMPAQKPGY